MPGVNERVETFEREPYLDPTPDASIARARCAAAKVSTAGGRNAHRGLLISQPILTVIWDLCCRSSQLYNIKVVLVAL
jgi:hypothetical protein